MAFVAVKPLPVSSCVAQRPALGFGRRRQQFGRARVAVPPFGRRLCSVRCTAEEDAAVQHEKPEAAEKTEHGDLNSHSVADSPVEGFGGWSEIAFEPEPESSWKDGIMRVGAGIVLAIGVSLVSYSYFEKQGKKFTQSPPPPANTQEKKTQDEALPQQGNPSKSSSPESDYFDDDDDVTFGDYSRKDDGDDFDEELEEDNDVDNKPNQINAVSVKDQDVSKQADQNDAKKQSVSMEADQNDANKQAVSKQADQNDAKKQSGLKQADQNDAKKQAVSKQADQNDAKKQSVSKKTDQNDAKKQAVSKKTDQNDAKVANEYDSDAQHRDWKVVVPAIVDRMHALALSALQALKIVEDGVDPGAVCTRRNYARWLIATSSVLTRSSANKVLPAMYIEEETELAFDDITPEDPDFAAIQGLAEAGLIPSKLSIMDAQSDEDEHGVVLFSPDSPLSRQDLVCWKVAIHNRSLPPITKEAFQKQSGFMDVDRIDSRAWSAIVSDLYSGDSSIIATAFVLERLNITSLALQNSPLTPKCSTIHRRMMNALKNRLHPIWFTRMLQPQKPVTNGQAAVALAYGDSSEQLGEEMARLEAEKMADEAVAAEAVMEARTQEEVKALFDGEVGAERNRREEAEKQLQEVKTALEKLTVETKSEKDSLLKDQAAVEAQKVLLREMQQKVDEQLQSLAAIQVEVTYEKERLGKLTAEAEEDQAVAGRLKTELAAEKQALILARSWAEEEAEKARAHHKVLDEARQRWASRGIEVTVDKSLDEDNIPGPSWRYSGGNTELSRLIHRAPIQDVMDKGEDLKTRVNNAVVRYWHAILEVVSRFIHRIVELLGAIRWRISELTQDTVSSVRHRAQDSFSSVNLRVQGAFSSVNHTVKHTLSSVNHGAQDTFSSVSHRVQDTGSVVAEKFRGAQSSVSGISAGAIDGTRRFADGCKSEIGKITQRFKHD